MSAKSNTGSPAASTPATPRPRQQAGSACDECRRRKLRCDRERPSCGACINSGVPCHQTTTRQPRGPKKGHLRALQSRIIALEQRLSDSYHDDCSSVDDEPLPFPDEMETFAVPPPMGPSHANMIATQYPYHSPMLDFLSREAPGLVHGDNLGTSSSSSGSVITPPTLPVYSSIECMSDLMRADLDHVFFERAYPFCPILNKQLYFSRSQQGRASNESEAFACLQYAMWTLASSLSSQFQPLQHELYGHTRLLLDSLDFDVVNLDTTQIEQVQAWMLLAIYEISHVGVRTGWSSAGKCFRFTVTMKLHCIDGRDGIATDPTSVLNSAEIEERRRIFWMAYAVDRFIGLLDKVPSTFDQHMVLTRLPTSDHEFQANVPSTADYLFNNQPDDTRTALHSTFAESVQLVTLCAQSLSHQQQGAVEYAGGCFPLEFWDRHQRLNHRLTQSMENLSIMDPCAQVHQDSMPLFTHMAAQAAVLMLYKASQAVPWRLDDYQEFVSRCEQRTVAAAQQMVSFCKALMQLSYFKIHPFTPVFLYLCADFLRANSHLDPTYEMQSQLQESLRCLLDVNKIALECLSRLQNSLTSGL